MFARGSSRLFSTTTTVASSNKLRLAGFGTAAALSGAYLFTQKVETEGKTAALNKDEWVPFKLLEVKQLNHNSSIFRFELPAGHNLGMSITSCVMTRFHNGEKDGKPDFVMRPYTPLHEGTLAPPPHVWLID
jgi:hypothetical protein